MRRLGYVGALVVTTVFVAGCGSNGGEDEATKSIGQEDFGKEWPFTVESGTVRCEGEGEVVFETGGKTYAVNGAAHSQQPDLAPLTDIWADTESGNPPKVDVAPVIDAGLALCDE